MKVVSQSRTAARALVASSSTSARSSTRHTRHASSSAKDSASAEAGPSTSTSSPADWSPALPAGQSKAYDLSLEYLASHRDRLLSRVTKLESSSSSPSQLDRLRIEALVNDPPTRRLFRTTLGRGNMDQPVMRHLAERQWTKEGGLDLLMQRVHQLNVVPDLLPSANGSYCPLTIEVGGATIEPGSICSASEWATPPILTLQLFSHPETPADVDSPSALYTLLMIDPDSPEPTTQSFSQRVHFAKADIPLSVLSGEQNLFDSSIGQELLSWEPPAPAQGSGKHRYVFLAIAQSSPSTTPQDLSREAFDLRQYIKSQSHLSDVVGVTLIRSKWTAEDDAHIRDTYLKHRGEEAPIYGKPSMEMKYGYPLSAKAARKEQKREEAWDAAMSGLEDIAAEVKQLEQESRATA